MDKKTQFDACFTVKYIGCFNLQPFKHRTGEGALTYDIVSYVTKVATDHIIKLYKFFFLQ